MQATQLTPRQEVAPVAATRMKAIARTEYGGPEALRLEARDVPAAGDDDVLVRVRAASVNAADRYLMQGKPYLMRAAMGLKRPGSHGLGQDLAGEVVAIGKNVTRLKPGDAVFGSIRDDFKADIDRAFSEYVRATEELLVTKPANVTFEQAAAVPLAALTALQGLRDCLQVKAGDRVLITGATSGVGTFAVQLAKAFGAEVTAVCRRGVEQVRSLGADHVVDSTHEDWLQGGPRFDVMLDVASTRTPSQCRSVLTPTGRYAWAGAPRGGDWLGPMIPMLRVVMSGWFSGKQRVTTVTERANQADLLVLRELLEQGKLKPLIDRRFGLSEVPEAMAHLETGHPVGKIVIAL